MAEFKRELTPIEIRLIEQYHKRLREKKEAEDAGIITCGTMRCPDCAHVMSAFSYECPVCGWEDQYRRFDFLKRIKTYPKDYINNYNTDLICLKEEN